MADWDFYSDNAQKVVRLVNLINYQTVPTEEAKFTESDHLSDEEEERESLDLSKKADKEFQDMKILLQPVADYLRSNVFGQDPIARQELVIRQDLKVFGKCDFSTPKAIVEMKSLYSKRSLRELSDLYRGQLYVTANNRDCYLLVAQGRKVSIYRVSFRPFGSVFPRRGYASARYTPEELAQKHVECPDGDKFCRYCGARFMEAAPSQKETPAPKQPEAPAPSKGLSEPISNPKPLEAKEKTISAAEELKDSADDDSGDIVFPEPPADRVYLMSALMRSSLLLMKLSISSI